VWQGEYFSEKPGNVRVYDSCQRIVREKISSGKPFTVDVMFGATPVFDGIVVA